MNSNRAIVVDPSVKGRLAIQEVASPTPLPSEALVRVAAISLNLGEVRHSTTAETGWRPGWDFAGNVERQAADGSGPHQGARVVGVLSVGTWAEVIAVPTPMLAELPDTVTFSQAATLPVAGLTAYRALEKGGFLVSKRVLITGASGGVGHFAVQLAELGKPWSRQVEQALNQAVLILLLISAGFLASDECYEQQMERTLERQKQGEVQVLPILVRPMQCLAACLLLHW